jgi:hypothetical protein
MTILYACVPYHMLISQKEVILKYNTISFLLFPKTLSTLTDKISVKLNKVYLAKMLQKQTYLGNKEAVVPCLLFHHHYQNHSVDST